MNYRPKRTNYRLLVEKWFKAFDLGLLFYKWITQTRHKFFVQKWMHNLQQRMGFGTSESIILSGFAFMSECLDKFALLRQTRQQSLSAQWVLLIRTVQIHYLNCPKSASNFMSFGQRWKYKISLIKRSVGGNLDLTQKN